MAAVARARRWGHAAGGDAGTPTDMDCDVLFGDDAAHGTERVLTFHCSFFHHLVQTAEASDATGRVVRMDDFVIPRREEVCEHVRRADIPRRRGRGDAAAGDVDIPRRRGRGAATRQRGRSVETRALALGTSSRTSRSGRSSRSSTP